MYQVSHIGLKPRQFGEVACWKLINSKEKVPVGRKKYAPRIPLHVSTSESRVMVTTTARTRAVGPGLGHEYPGSVGDVIT